ncbi:MAG: hypothetical protein AB1640_19875 [bacterium]
MKAVEMGIQEVKDQVIKEIEGDPFDDPSSWDLIEKNIPKEHWDLFLDRSSAAKFLRVLPQIFPCESFSADPEAQSCWEMVGNFHKNVWRLHEALSIYFGLYDHLIAAQAACGKRRRKGTPLVWMSDCYSQMSFPVHAKRCLMLALIENAIHEEGNVPPDTTGTYWRLVFRHGLPDSEIKRYGKMAYELWRQNQDEAMFPQMGFAGTRQ